MLLADGRTVEQTPGFSRVETLMAPDRHDEMIWVRPNPVDNVVFASGDWTYPVPGHTSGSRDAGMHLHPIHKVVKCHEGDDIGAPTGTRVVASQSGRVRQAWWNGGYGNQVQIDHGEKTVSSYAHLSTMAVKKGDTITAGQKIGTVGSTGASTGPHLHFEIRVNGTPYNPRHWVGDGTKSSARPPKRVAC